MFFQLLKNKLLISLGFIFFYKVGCMIPMPGIDTNAINLKVGWNQMHILKMFVGNQKFISIFYMGIFPWIIASIVLQMATFIIPALEKSKRDEGEKGMEKIDLYTKIAACIIALPNAIYLGNTIYASGCVIQSWKYCTFIAMMAIVCTTSCMIITWLGQHVNEHGIGSGPSLIISVNILQGILTKLYDLDLKSRLILIVFGTLLSGLIAAFDGIYERVELYVPRFLVSRTQDLFNITSTTCYLPMKVNYAGIMGAIFASSFMSLIIRASETLKTWLANQWYYYSAFAVCVLFFSCIYSLVNFSVDEISKSLSKMPAIIQRTPGGLPTETKLVGLILFNALLNSAFLLSVSAAPELATRLLGFNFTVINGTNLFIVVGSASEIVDHLKAIHMESKHLTKK